MMLAGTGAFAERRRIDSIQFYASDMARTKMCYTAVFGWKLTGPPIILYAFDLAATEAKVR